MTQRGIELELPDLPQLPIRVGAAQETAGARARPPLLQRLRETLGTALPLVLMALLALGSWWLVRNAPKPLPAPTERPAREAPDYLMQGFEIRRFDAQGEARVRVQGQRLRHYESPQRIEIEEATITASAADGREAVLTARNARADPQGRRIELLGQAQVRARAADGRPLRIDSQALTLEGATQQMRTEQPVTVQWGASTLQAQGLQYDHPGRRLELKGPVRAELLPDERS